MGGNHGSPPAFTPGGGFRRSDTLHGCRQPIGRGFVQRTQVRSRPVFLTSDFELLDHLRSYLENATGLPVRLITRRTYQEITSLLLSGQLDAACICGFPFMANHPRLALVAVPHWQGWLLYRSYLITDPDRQVGTLEALRGDVHAFSDPDSNSGWLVTAAALARRNLSPERFFGQTTFTYGHRNVVRAVASGLAMSGSTDGYVYEVMRETEPNLIARTRIVRQSDLLGSRRGRSARISTTGSTSSP